MWVQVWVNGSTRGTRKVSGIDFIRRINNYAIKHKLDIVVTDSHTGQIIY